MLQAEMGLRRQGRGGAAPDRPGQVLTQHLTVPHQTGDVAEDSPSPL